MAQGPVAPASAPESWNLHDAVLASLPFDWKDRSCVVTLAAFLDPGQPAVACSITFEDVSDLSVPHHRPWGPSVHVNDLVRTDEAFVLEMQSGDAIRIVAARVRLVRSDRAR